MHETEARKESNDAEDKQGYKITTERDIGYAHLVELPGAGYSLDVCLWTLPVNTLLVDKEELPAKKWSLLTHGLPCPLK